jgi:tRNA-specific 2-thiouridylase
MNEDGKIIGTHSGIHNFTIGQRRGFGKSFGSPVFVKSIDGNTAEVILTFDENKLFSKKLIAKDINWINKSFSERKTFRAEVQIRYKHSAAAATVVLSSNTDSAEVIFDETQRAVTPGQIAAFYDGNELIGGGIISLAG